MRKLALVATVLTMVGCAAPKTQTTDVETSASVSCEAWRQNRIFFSDQQVSFELGSSDLSAEATDRVRQVANQMKANPSSALSIEGHGDGLGTDKQNYALGERRAEALQKELTRLGVDPDRMVTWACGKKPKHDRGYAAGAPRKWRLAEFILLTPPL